MPSTQIPDQYQTAFSDNFYSLSEQKNSRLQPGVKMVRVEGKEKKISQMGSVALTKITQRNQETTYGDVDMPSRWIRPEGYQQALLLDSLDEVSLGELESPKGDYVTKMVRAFQRQKDIIIAEAAVGAAVTGPTGGSTTALPESQKVAVDYVRNGSAANSGLTLDKLIRARHLLLKNDIDEDMPLYFACSQSEITDLLHDEEVIRNNDYSEVRRLETGQIKSYLGFNFLISNRIPVASNDLINCFAFTQDAIQLGIGKDVEITIDRLPTKSNSWQTMLQVSMAATRVEDALVVQVQCDQSP